MFGRISKTKSLRVTSIIFGSTLQIGDCSYINGTSHALAVQRRSDILYERDDQFSDYEVFFRPSVFPAITEHLQMTVNNPCPFIETGNIIINAMSTSSITNIGNVGHIQMNSRIHHTRLLDSNSKNATNPGLNRK